MRDNSTALISTLSQIVKHELRSTRPGNPQSCLVGVFNLRIERLSRTKQLHRVTASRAGVRVYSSFALQYGLMLIFRSYAGAMTPMLRLPLRYSFKREPVPGQGESWPPDSFFLSQIQSQCFSIERQFYWSPPASSMLVRKPTLL